jgi:hypothetical protein
MDAAHSSETSVNLSGLQGIMYHKIVLFIVTALGISISEQDVYLASGVKGINNEPMNRNTRNVVCRKITNMSTKYD